MITGSRQGTMNADIQQRINEGLARAMGWTVSKLGYKSYRAVSIDGHVHPVGFVSESLALQRAAPDYFANDAAAHQAKDALLRWWDEDCRWTQLFRACAKWWEIPDPITDHSYGINKQIALASPGELALVSAVALGIVDEKEIE